MYVMMTFDPCFACRCMYNSDGDYLIGGFCHMTSVYIVSRKGAVVCLATLPSPPLPFLPSSLSPFPSLSLPPQPLPPFTSLVRTVVQQGKLKVNTEFGKIEAGPGEIVVIQVREEGSESEQGEGRREGQRRG